MGGCGQLASRLLVSQGLSCKSVLRKCDEQLLWNLSEEKELVPTNAKRRQ